MEKLRDLLEENTVLIVSPRHLRETTIDERGRAYTDPDYAHKIVEWAILDTDDPVELSEDCEYSGSLNFLKPHLVREGPADNRGRVNVGADLEGEQVTIAVLNVRGDNGAD